MYLGLHKQGARRVHSVNNFDKYWSESPSAPYALKSAVWTHAPPSILQVFSSVTQLPSQPASQIAGRYPAVRSRSLGVHLHNKYEETRGIVTGRVGDHCHCSTVEHSAGMCQSAEQLWLQDYHLRRATAATVQTPPVGADTLLTHRLVLCRLSDTAEV